MNLSLLRVRELPLKMAFCTVYVENKIRSYPGSDSNSVLTKEPPLQVTIRKIKVEDVHLQAGQIPCVQESGSLK